MVEPLLEEEGSPPCGGEPSEGGVLSAGWTESTRKEGFSLSSSTLLYPFFRCQVHFYNNRICPSGRLATP